MCDQQRQRLAEAAEIGNALAASDCCLLNANLLRTWGPFEALINDVYLESIIVPVGPLSHLRLESDEL